MTDYADKVVADGATHLWKLDDPVRIAVGTATSSGDPFGAGFGADKAIDGTVGDGWATSTALSNGAWWQETWGAPVTAWGAIVKARSSDANPTATWLLSNGATGSVPALSGGAYYIIDFGGSQTFTTLRLTFTAAAGAGLNPGWANVDVGGVAVDAIGSIVGGLPPLVADVFGATGPAGIAGAGGVTIPANDTSYIAFNAPISGMPSGNADRTVEFWAKTSRASDATVIEWGDTTTTREMFAAIYNHLGFDISVATVADDPGRAITGDAHRDGSFHHVAIVYDGASKTAEIYFDGVSVGTTTAFGANLATDTTGMAIGRLLGTANFYFDGVISLVSVYDTKLTSGQVADHAAGDTAAPVELFTAVIIG